ncbi:PBP1A family penicillin-binding protein [Synechococcus sp. ATX 2A4]|uniref:transglycosylase domain-containing protein n=1 Tax=Synechococcus sp. ATX 2A4 TaxID=2823727 RepID=UPI0020CFA1BC|nr:PBP1A family penicillin-binding protein [Synechococcus sp. ATX 2A4]MCP9885140.1 PBP1A family penicillin-binding protein [Synechococcus sp. ATX 2A4]
MRRRQRQLLVTALLAAGAGGVVAVGQAFVVRTLDQTLPDVSRIGTFNRPGTVTILSADGQVLQKLGPATREKLVGGQMPELVEQAFIAAEDRRFYEHSGIDAWGIGRALWRNVQRGAVEEGASTITQQLARLVFLSQDPTLVRKLQEALLAGKLERELSKEQILEQYLNYVYLGSSAYGVADAAWIYFSKTPEELTLPQAALIAGLPPAPSVYSPLVNPDLAQRRRAVVLRRMREAGFIDASEEAEANGAPLDLKPAEPKFWTSRAPYFTSWVAQELPKVLTPEQLEVGGLTIRSSLNLVWQKEAEQVIERSAFGAMEGALVTIEPGTGLVRAMVGGKNFNESQFNRATQALRSPGSTFKLFVYLAALKAGMTPETTVLDAPRCFAGYCPKNFGNRYLGRVSLAVALQNSLNVVAVSLLQQVGFDKVIAVAQGLGITRELGRFYPMGIGAYEQTVLDMTAAYAGVVNRGIFVPPTPFEEISGPEGQLLWSRRVQGDRGRRVVSSDVADAMVWMLQRVVTNGTGGGAALPNRPVAGKTGTSEGARDLWFVGAIPQLTTGVWLGFDNNRKTNSDSGAAAAAWGRYMAVITKDLPVRPFPPKPALTNTFNVRGVKPPAPARPVERAPEAPRSWEPTPTRPEQDFRDDGRFRGDPADPAAPAPDAPTPAPRPAPEPAPATPSVPSRPNSPSQPPPPAAAPAPAAPPAPPAPVAPPPAPSPVAPPAP